MKKQTIFIKRYPSKGELPKESRIYITNLGALHYLHPFQRWLDNDPQWWMQEIELPSKEEIENMAEEMAFPNSVKFGANYILNKLK